MSGEAANGQEVAEQGDTWEHPRYGTFHNVEQRDGAAEDVKRRRRDALAQVLED